MSDGRKALLFVGLVFGAGWALVGVIALMGGLANHVAFAWLANAMPLVPALAAVVMRLWVSREGFADSGLRVGRYRLYLLAYFLPLAAVALSYAAISALGFGRLTLDPAELYEKGPLPRGEINILIVSAFLLDPLVNSIQTFGEELGWRGYLLPKLLGLGVVPALTLQALLWGLWQAPIVLISSQTVEQALVGAGLTVLYGLAAGTVWGILFLASGSVFIPAFAAAVRASMVGLFGFLLVAQAPGYREAGGLAEIIVWTLVAAAFLTPLPIFRAAPRREA